jgi:hypothetical protein
MSLMRSLHVDVLYHVTEVGHLEMIHTDQWMPRLQR